MRRLLVASLLSLTVAGPVVADEIEFPKVLDPRLKIELVARDPEVTTPTGLAVDAEGRVWVIENNTHFRPADYPRAERDRILVFPKDRRQDDRSQAVVFKDDLQNTMSVAVRPAWIEPVSVGTEPAADRQLFVATRSDLLLCEDLDGDLRCDRTTVLAHLDTPGNYPHNGLGGLAFARDGSLYFGFGENLGARYDLVSRGGEKLSGGGEGGNLYRMRPDGTQLERWATGFWNPHASCVTPGGDIFSVDNDPDSRPPCRLLHVVKNGDYGYRFRNGRRGTHPFTAWNGEIPGTLPMLAGTGEAPSGIVQCPTPAGGPLVLLVASWGDHRLERYVLTPGGGSFTAKPAVLVQGGEDFRPVGLARGPDGSLYFSDWMKRDYQVHNHGRVWRLTIIAGDNDAIGLPLNSPPAAARPVPRKANGVPHWRESFRFHEYVASLEVPNDRRGWLAGDAGNEDVTLARLIAMESAGKLDGDLLKMATASPHLSVRRMAVQWIGEHKHGELRGEVERVLSQEPMTKDLLLACLASLSLLDGQPPAEFEKQPSQKYALPIALDAERPASLQAQALRLVSPPELKLTPDTFARWLASNHLGLRQAAVEILQQSPLPERDALLQTVAVNEQEDVNLRAEAIVGLSGVDHHAVIPPASIDLLLSLTKHPEAPVRIEAVRALRHQTAPGSRVREQLEALKGTADPEVLAQLELALQIPQRPRVIDEVLPTGDADAGRRVFFHPHGAVCGRCHTVDGRGGQIGPDLTYVARTMSRDKLAHSILHPSAEISPQFATYTVVLDDGRVVSGLMLDSPPAGKLRLRTSTGEVIEIGVKEVEEQQVSPVSLMPQGLDTMMTVQEMGDLLSYLETLK